MQPPVKMALPVKSSDMVEVDTILDRAIAAGDPLIAAEYGNRLIRITGVTLAKLLYGMRSNWLLFRASGIEEEFADFVDAHMMLKGRTANKYADMYEAVFESPNVPDNLKHHLANKPIGSLLLLTAAVREGSLNVEDLEDVIVLDHNGVRQKVREARGDATNSKTAVYARLVQRDHSVYPKGTIVVFGTSEDGHEEIEAVGYLKLNEARTESGQKYIQRMINTLGLEDIR